MAKREARDAAPAAKGKGRGDGTRGRIGSTPVPVSKGWKPPRTLGLAADKLYATRERRLALADAVEALKSEEAALKNHIIESLPKSDANGIAGKTCRVSVVTKEVPRAEDWAKIYAGIVDDYRRHVRAKDGLEDAAFALLQRRLGDSAVKEAWEYGRTIDGVGRFTVVDLSLSKI